MVQAKDAATSAKVSAESERDAAIQANAATQKALTDAEKILESTRQATLGSTAAMEKALAFSVRASEAATSAELEAKRAATAHNLSTTAGLAGAFNQKAKATEWRQWGWASALVVALGSAGVIGWVRFSDLKALMEAKPSDVGLVAQLVLTILGVGAPVWLAWISTKMISKTLAISEDYSYKAALAQAYVGFRDEAKGLDPLLEQRLFAAAVTQLDANPVRFLDAQHPSSPLQELLQQPFMQNVLESATIKQHLIDWFNARFKLRLVVPASADKSASLPLPPST